MLRPIIRSHIFILCVLCCASCAAKETSVGPSLAGEAPPGKEGPPAPLSIEIPPPSATDKYVFVPLPSIDAVAKIDAQTLSVTSIAVGKEPRGVVTTPDNTYAVVFNSASYSVSIIRADTNAVNTVPVRKYFNTMLLSPDGKHAVSYFDLALSGGSIKIDDVRSFNDVSVVEISTGIETVYPVGFNPTMVQFTSDGKDGIVISDNKLTLIEFTTSTLTTVSLVQNPFDTRKPREIVVHPQGTMCFVIYQGSDQISAVNLSSKAITTTTAGPGVSDIALSTDGSALYVVNGGNGTLSVISATTLTLTTFTPPSSIAINRVAAASDGTKALLYSSAGAEAKVTVVDTSSFTFTSYPLVKPVSSLVIDPSGLAAIIIHQGMASTGNPILDQFFNSYPTVSLFRLSTGESNPIAVISSPGRLAVSPDGAYAFLLIPGSPSALIADLSTFIVDGVSLPSRPEFVGVLPGAYRAYISEDHPLGRVSFLDGVTDKLDTVTGFALNPLIR